MVNDWLDLGPTSSAAFIAVNPSVEECEILPTSSRSARSFLPFPAGSRFLRPLGRWSGEHLLPDGWQSLPGRLVGGFKGERDIRLRREEQGHIRQRIADGDRLEEDLGAGEPDIRNTGQGHVVGQCEVSLAVLAPDRAVDAVRVAKSAGTG